jgi:hypothetical protein
MRRFVGRPSDSAHLGLLGRLFDRQRSAHISALFVCSTAFLFGVSLALRGHGQLPLALFTFRLRAIQNPEWPMRAVVFVSPHFQRAGPLLCTAPQYPRYGGNSGSGFITNMRIDEKSVGCPKQPHVEVH